MGDTALAEFSQRGEDAMRVDGWLLSDVNPGRYRTWARPSVSGQSCESPREFIFFEGRVLLVFSCFFLNRVTGLSTE